MKTIVCIKEANGGPDLNALEKAIEISDEVLTVTMGPESSKIIAGEALARGATKALHISDKALKDSDTIVTARVLARAIEKAGEYDMILLGNESKDSATAQVGPMLAEDLGIEQITNVMELHDRQAVKIMDGKKITVNYNYPILITVNSRINSPDVYNMSGIFNEKELVTMDLADLGIDPETVGAIGSPTKSAKVIKTENASHGEWIEEGTAKGSAQKLIERLKEVRAI